MFGEAELSSAQVFDRMQGGGGGWVLSGLGGAV